MQVNQPKISAAKANTPKSTRPSMSRHGLDLPSICDICGKPRPTRKHQVCSRIRQRLKAEEWATYMENLAAKKSQGRGRYAKG